MARKSRPGILTPYGAAAVLALLLLLALLMLAGRSAWRKAHEPLPTAQASTAAIRYHARQIERRL